MKESIWTESLLKAYAKLQNYIEQINERINLLALTVSSVQYGTTTEVIVDKIFKLIEKKKIIFKTKIMIDEMLTKINPKYAYVLKMKFAQNKSNKEIAEYFGVSERSVRRYLIEGINYFKRHIKKEYEPYKVLSSYYKNETWMAGFYYASAKRVLLKQDKSKYNKFIKSFNFKELKSYEKLYEYDI